MSTPTIYPYSTPTGIINLVPLDAYEQACRERDQFRADVAELNERMTTEVKSYLASMAELRAENRRLEKELAHQTDMASQAAVCEPKAALDEAIRRMEAVPVNEMWKIFNRTKSLKEVRYLLIAAIKDVEALPVTPNAAECGQCADMESEFEDFERAGAAPKP